ncbi:hypothetical protein PHLGIDRAFT_31748 [Phlebiopsis gigantea 11061_1 CR5-6]|uniref:Uncharacterized protein n=1 Tax=Phlebiopsis gigantea (strain 11061_1 CR5-6) TaxID=745531 RepID=A0A0C3PDW9_PHLG1|nr:hypothetical protein PHLGIDRAFT_31748 [Phlebiopsis gigantea 11061_1 CR5-6]
MSLEGACPQQLAISPEEHSGLLAGIEKIFKSEDFRLGAYESLGGAVRIPTEMFDDLPPPGQDPHWEIFADMHAYMESRFPLIHSSLKRTLVNKYALVYHWQGSDKSLQPALLTAHQDVVPVEPQTVSTWINPPFSGLYDGEWIWGRGSCDDKSGLISSMIATETLLAHGFTPKRTIVYAFGIDEERGGVSGATALKKYLLKTYGKDAFSILVDEGGRQDLTEHAVVAAPAVAEKGSFNLRMEVSSPGGHSSVPPPHTSIGLLASLIAALEANPHEVHLYRNDTYYEELQCQAAHNPDFSDELRELVAKSASNDKALTKLTEELNRINPAFKAIAGTTQAVDVIRGGVKTNALPENAYVIVNHRIAGYSSVGALKSHLVSTVKPVADKFNLSVDAFGMQLGDVASSYGQVSLRDAFGTGLEPAPVTPGAGHGPYDLLSGTIRNVLATSPRTAYENKTFIVISLNATRCLDTKHYWDLTRHIFRYSHLNTKDGYNGAHTVNEGEWWRSWTGHIGR